MTLLEMSLSSIAIVLAVVVIRALFLHKLPKKVFLILWGVVLCRLFLPFSFASKYSLYTLINRVSAYIGLAEQSITAPSSPLTELYINFVISKFPVSPVASFNWIEVIWSVGAIITAVAFLIPHICFCHVNKAAIPMEDVKLNAWISEHRIKRRVRVKQSENIKIPVTYGILKPVILLPKSLKQSDEEQLRFVLVHELTHIKHFDILLKWILLVAVSMHWFNPFVWIMYVLANRDIELSCDETVLRTTDGEFSKTSYAMALISLEEHKLKVNPIGNYFNRNAIEERITSIMKTKKITVLSVLTAFILVAGTITVFSTASAVAEDSLTNTHCCCINFSTKSQCKNFTGRACTHKKIMVSAREKESNHPNLSTIKF
jgi:bla regulator protein BlaR1